MRCITSDLLDCQGRCWSKMVHASGIILAMQRAYDNNECVSASAPCTSQGCLAIMCDTAG